MSQPNEKKSLPFFGIGKVLPFTKKYRKVMCLMVACGLAPSNKQARQLVEQGGVFVNDEKVPAATMLISREMLQEGVKIRKGKKVFHKAVLA